MHQAEYTSQHKQILNSLIYTVYTAELISN